MPPDIDIKTELPDTEPDEDYPKEFARNASEEPPDEKPFERLTSPLFQGLPRFAEQDDTSSATVIEHGEADEQMKSVHFMKKFVCEFCTKTFVAPYYLRRHLESHNHVRNFECAICHRRLKTKRTLQLHMTLHEGSCKIFKCSDCDFMSKRKHSLKRHQIRKHTKFFPFKCQYCPKMFKLNADLTRHLRQHVVAPCLCENCGKAFQNEYFLRLHHRSLHKSRRCNAYKVEERDDVKSEQETSEFSRSGQMIRRSKRNVVQTQFKCPKCRWRFRSWRLLHKHLKRHLLSYKCEKCAAIFKYKASFLKHKTIHKD